MSVRIVKYGIATMLLGFVALLSSCASSNVREAQKVVAQADSLWHEGKMYGVDMGDSATLAQAYETLSSFNSPLLSILNARLTTDFAHAGYHYGKLLRAKENPVEAMQVFIETTHSRTDDYHILGRVYSNMGSICHLAGEYPLSYDMYEKSANLFLKNGDTLLYYYGLNNMAFEKSMQSDKRATITLLNAIEQQKEDDYLQQIVLETYAELYLRCKQYDSAIYYANTLCLCENPEPTALLIKAQAYSYLSYKDSATHYAEQVLHVSQLPANRNNALQVLISNNAGEDIKSVQKMSAERADVQKILKIRQGKVAQAVQLLQQDITRKPNLLWLYSLLTTLIFVAAGIIIYVLKKRKRQALLVQKLELLQQATSSIQIKNEKLTECYIQNHKQIVEDINKKCSMLHDTDKIKKTLAWKDYNKMCIIVDKQFYLLASKLRSKQFLNETEIRICVLTLLDCGYEQMAELLYRSSTSIGTLKMRVAKKFGTSSKQLRQYLIENECIK